MGKDLAGSGFVGCLRRMSAVRVASICNTRNAVRVLGDGGVVYWGVLVTSHCFVVFCILNCSVTVG